MQGYSFNLNFTTNGGAVLVNVNSGLNQVQDNVTKTTKVFGECYKALLAVDLASQGIAQLGQMLDSVIAPGIALNSQMADLSAITGLTGEGLKAIEIAARESAKTFGTDASQNVNSYKLLLSQLSPEIAKSSEAMKLMGNNVNILSKTMGGDTVAATNVLTTALNQYGVNMDNPIAASKAMSDMMNVMAASAKEGSAELPQIQAALSQAGMTAKTVGLSFVETNAAIQMLDKAGKKGSEGGVALRNVLSTLSQGKYTLKDATEGLAAAGISVDKLADSSIPLTERLKMLQPVMSDTALMGKVFGKENMAGAIALIQSADAQDELQKKITGTNTATEQARTIMGNYQERMNRATAVMNDWKISIFNATEAYMPYIKHTMTSLTTLGEASRGYMAVKSVLEAFLPNLFTKTIATQADTVATNTNTVSMGIGARIANWYRNNIMSINRQMLIGSIISMIFSRATNAVRNAMLGASGGVRAFSVAIMSIPVIGWVIAAITAVIVVIKLLWDNSKRFREILFGIWEAAKAVFHNIGVFFKRVWDTIIKPIMSLYWTVFKAVWGAIWDIVKKIFNGIGDVFTWYYNMAVSVFTAVYDFIMNVFVWISEKISAVLSFIASVFTSLWNWFSSVFSGFVSFIDEWLIQPIKNAFSGVWTFIVELFEKVMDKLSNVFAPIKKFFKTLFSSEGMTDLEIAYKEGEKKGGASYEKDQDKKEKTQKVEVVGQPDDFSIFDVTKGFQNGAVPPTQPIAGVGAKEKKEGGTGGGSGIKNLTINKLVENMILHFHGTVKESKESIKQAVTEVLLTSVNDVNLAN